MADAGVAVDLVAASRKALRPYSTASYNALNQLTDLSGQTLTWDADGNLTSDGPRTYTWDAENRLVGIAYPGEPGKATSFAYDGLGRRVAITSIPAGGGSSVTTSYLWCGSVLCQALDASNATTREYLAEGEYVPGVTPETDYYGIDQIGTVRRVFASTSSAAAFRYDPYGVPLQVTAPTTDFTYAGMFHNADSGLDLTLYRAYDPVAGRWLSRDPLGEGPTIRAVTDRQNTLLANIVTQTWPSSTASQGESSGRRDTDLLRSLYYDNHDASYNLYKYVSGNPIDRTDTIGLADITSISPHALRRMQERLITPQALIDACTNPLRVISQPNGNIKYIGSGATVVLSPTGEAVTVW